MKSTLKFNFKHYFLGSNMTQSSMQNLKACNLSLILIWNTSAISIFIDKDQINPLHLLLYHHTVFMAFLGKKRSLKVGHSKS